MYLTACFLGGPHIGWLKHLYSDFFYPFYDIKGKKRFYEFIAYWRGLKFIRRLVERSYLQFIFLA